jgi:cysteine desulfurase/selenocysteine lyase
MVESLLDAFGTFARAWLNTAHQGPLPLEAAEAAREAIEQKLDPRQIPEEAFFEIPRRAGRSHG